MVAVASALDGVRIFGGTRAFACEFSICSVLYRPDSYERMLASFRKAGFDDTNSEVLAFDNRGRDRYDGYAFIRHAIAEAKGRYLILCHDDVELLDDDVHRLRACLAELTATDPGWSVAGVAGGVHYQDRAGHENLRWYRVVDRDGRLLSFGTGALQRAGSLDECFLIVAAERAVLPSQDLSGFHFYGSDLCLQAEVSGSNAWIVPFLIRHHGMSEKGEPYERQRAALVEKYRRFFPRRWIQTTTGKVSFRRPRPDAIETKAPRRLVRRLLRRLTATR